MWELHGNNTTWFQQQFHPRNKIIQIRHVRQNIIAQQQIRFAIFIGICNCRFATVETHFGSDTTFLSFFGDIGSWLNPEYRNTSSGKVLQ